MHWARVDRTSPKSSIFNFNTTYTQTHDNRDKGEQGQLDRGVVDRVSRRRQTVGLAGVCPSLLDTWQFILSLGVNTLPTLHYCLSIVSVPVRVA